MLLRLRGRAGGVVEQDDVAGVVQSDNGEMLAVGRPAKIVNVLRIEMSELAALGAVHGLNPNVIHALVFDE